MKIWCIPVVLVLTIAAFGANAQNYVNLTVEGIPGESTSTPVTGAANNNRQSQNIQLLSFSDSAVNPAALSTGREGAGRINHFITFTIPFNVSADALQKVFANGKMLTQIQFQYVSRTANAAAPKYVISSNEAIVSGFRVFTTEGNSGLYAEITLFSPSVMYAAGSNISPVFPNNTESQVKTIKPSKPAKSN